MTTGRINQIALGAQRTRPLTRVNEYRMLVKQMSECLPSRDQSFFFPTDFSDLSPERYELSYQKGPDGHNRKQQNRLSLLRVTPITTRLDRSPSLPSLTKHRSRLRSVQKHNKNALQPIRRQGSLLEPRLSLNPLHDVYSTPRSGLSMHGLSVFVGGCQFVLGGLMLYLMLFQ